MGRVLEPQIQYEMMYFVREEAPTRRQVITLNIKQIHGKMIENAKKNIRSANLIIKK